MANGFLDRPVEAGSLFNIFGAPSHQEAELEHKKQAAVVGAAQMVLQNPNATEEQVKAASAAMEKNGFDPIMVQGLIPGPAGPQLKTVGARERLVSIPPGGGAPTELVSALPGAAGGGAKASEFERQKARWLGLREKERTGTLTSKEKDDLDVTFRKLTAQPNVMGMIMESAFTGQPFGAMRQPPQPGATPAQGGISQRQQQALAAGTEAIAAGKDKGAVMERLRTRFGLTDEQMQGL